MTQPARSPFEADPDEIVEPVDAPDWDRYESVSDDLEQVAPPRQVAQYLLPGEVRCIAVREHWIRLLPAPAGLVGAVVLASLVNAALIKAGKASAAPVHNTWAVCLLAGLGWFTWKWQEWRGTWFVLTAKRAISIRSFPRTRVEQLSLAKIKQGDVALEQSIFGQAAGYGSLDFASFATEKALDRVDWLPDPVMLFNEINRLITPAESQRAPGT